MIRRTRSEIKTHYEDDFKLQGLKFPEINEPVRVFYKFNEEEILSIFEQECRLYENVLNEWYRVLKKDGILRIAVPDFKSIVNYYNKTADIDSLLGLVVGGQKFGEYDYHKMIFDEGFLKNKLQDIGFRLVARYEWRDVSHSNIDDFSQAYLPHMEKESGMLMSLNMEAVK